MKQRLLEQSVIHADESVVHVLKEDGKPASSESQIWVYGSGERSTTLIRLLNTSLTGAASGWRASCARSLASW